MLSFWSSAKAAAGSSTEISPAVGDALVASPTSDKAPEEPFPRVSLDETARTIVPSTSTSTFLPDPRAAETEVVVVVTEQSLPVAAPAPARPRRISFRSFGFFYGKANTKDKGKDKERPSMSVEEGGGIVEEEGGEGKEPPAPPAKAASGAVPPPKKPSKRAEKSALVLRDLMLGSTETSGKNKPSQNTLKKVKGQLLQTKDANKVIAKLRTLPNPDGPVVAEDGSGEAVVLKAAGPIHAVCLEVPEAEAEADLFSRLTTNADSSQPTSIASADMGSLVAVLNDTRLVTLVSSPDFGFGQPPGGDGPLAGSVPSPGAINQGFKEVTVQLLALGFATSKAVFPDHTGVYPPTDRMSVLTYWWGLEVCLPPPTMAYLANVKSIQTAALNFLTAFALFNNGVKEILPFVRYISQFLDFEWGAIKGADKGNGVVCASTWVMPAAMVPRAWDFPPPPPEHDSKLKSGKPDSTTATSPTLVFPGSKTSPFTPSTPVLPPVMVTPATLPRSRS